MNKKIFITLFAFIGFMFFFNCSNVFASYDVTIDGEKYSLPDLPEPNSGSRARYCMLYSDLQKVWTYGGGNWYITFWYMCSNEPIKLSRSGDKYTAFRGSEHTSFYCIDYHVDSSWKVVDADSSESNASFSLSKGIPVDNPSCPFLETNHGITALDSDTTVFYPAPQEEEPAPTPTSTLQVAPTLTSTDLSGILAQILAILPVVLTVLISLLALRKAIRLLLRILGQA